ncbi:hypothetical protein JW899_00195 [Candidatus Uhrbacteria bacterium]|nr:hypothetical protein [Candidatus Uhrbacteria bacterium]
MDLPSAWQPYRCSDEVKAIPFCPFCRSGYGPESTRILEWGGNDAGDLLHIRCGNCLNSVIARVQSSSAGVSSVGLVTDLDYAEVGRFSKAPPISTDDVLDIHSLLQDDRLLFSQLAVT